MKRIFTLTTIALLSTFGMINAQTLSEPTMRQDKTKVRCYTYEAIKETRLKNPSAESDAQFEAWMGGQLAKRKAAKTALVNYTLPIVFHIISAGEAVGTTPNISASFVKAQVMMLNQAFGNKVGSPYAVSADAGLTFALAQNNPSGVALVEPGIDRINRVTKGWTDYTNGWDRTYVDGTVKAQSYWDPAKYINIWVMPSLVSGTTTLVGYATFPASSGLAGLNSTETAQTAGVAIITTSIASNYTKSSCNPSDPYNTGKSLVHELGHFFGLRHIWGDGTCADDYCADTPPSETANYGVYYHPKSNGCGTPDEMFEDYMDYTDDVVLNTLTADQVARIQTVMVNSPRRNTLAASPAGFVPVVGSNNVAFVDYCVDSLNVFETGLKSSSNRFYKDIYVNISTEDKATDVGSITFTNTGTAVNGVDYEMIPSTVNFVTGDGIKPVVLRVYDNQAVDGDRKIILGLNITGPGISAGAAHQTFTVNIIDDDNIKVGQNTINLLEEHFDAGVGTNGLPAGWRALKTANPANAFVASTNGNAGGTGACAHITNNTTTKPNVYVRGTAGAAVLQSIVVDPTSVQSLGSLNFKYTIRGRGTPAAQVDYARLTYTLGQTTGPFYFWNTTASLTGAGPYCTNNATPISNAVTNLACPPAISDKKFTVSFYWATGAVTTGGDPGFNVDDITITATPFPIETTVSSSYGYRLPATLINNFRSVNKRQVIRIIGSSADVDGVVASVSEAGNDQVLINTEATGTFYRSRKVVTVAPAIPNTTATYTATIYFTQAEIAAWGVDKSLVKVVQVADATVFATGLNPSNALLITPTTVDDQLSTNGYIAYTFSTTGFGSFVIVSSATLLPLKLINFSGTLKNNATNLKWTTANEANTKGFDVERSIDGIAYKAVGFVKGQNNANNEYTFNDEKIVKGNKYFYRLKMMDLDGKFVYSNVVTITFIDKDKWFSVYPSPVKDVLFIQNNTAASQNAEITITEVSGKIVYKHSGTVAGKLEVAVSNWSAGTYIVKINSNDAETTLKVVKQ